MTVRTTRLRKSDAKLTLLAFAWWIAGSVVALAASEARLPIIQNVGVIPVQWEGSASAIPNKDTIEQGFPTAVRSTHRFRVLGDELVAGLWQTERGRSDLRDQYEAQALMGLTVNQRDGVITLTARLMDAALKTELLETETITTGWLTDASPQQITDKLESLTYRIINRLPVDVAVTSVQGQFLTLSGGTEQNIAIGDHVDLVRSNIKSLHPANGTWLEFQTKPLGTAQIVDVKSTTSVARITKQTYDNAIEVSDGARISAIASRVKFARLAANSGLKDAGRQDTVIVSPLYVSGAAPIARLVGNKLAEENETAPDPEQTNAVNADYPISESKPSASPNPAVKPNENQVNSDESSPNLWDDISKEAGGHRLIDYASLSAGPILWRVSGVGIAGAASKFPMLLMNNIGANISRTLIFKIKNDFGAKLLAGSTAKGRFSGYEGSTRIYWEEDLPVVIGGIVKGWRGGGVGHIKGLSVTGESFGGGDWVSGGGFIGLLGTLPASLLGDRYDWSAEFALIPLTIGRVGLAGKWQQIQSAFGYHATLDATQYRPPQMIAWGAGIDIGNEEQSLRNDLRAKFRVYDIHVLAKYRF